MGSTLPRGWLVDTVALYGRVFRRAAGLALRNWPVGLVVIVYGVLLEVAMLFAGPLGIVGRFLVYLAGIACVSSWLSLVAVVLRTGRVRLEDVPTSFSTYFGDLLNVGFLFWGIQLIASLVLAPFAFLRIVFGLAVIVFLNAVPELVYVGRHSATEVFVESYRFIGENWIEWFPANLVIAAAIVAVSNVPDGPFGIVNVGALGIVLYFGMIVRGLLFQELTTSSRRAREFRRRAAS
ncbi:MAG TPA: hypothetical protein VKA21_06440 [Candidatus Binatia bacterium]|nr:hypothetical protein [Candidatus Binatia bacterium]